MVGGDYFGLFNSLVDPLSSIDCPRFSATMTLHTVAFYCDGWLQTICSTRNKKYGYKSVEK